MRTKHNITHYKNIQKNRALRAYNVTDNPTYTADFSLNYPHFMASNSADMPSSTGPPTLCTDVVTPQHDFTTASWSATDGPKGNIYTN